MTCWHLLKQQTAKSILQHRSWQAAMPFCASHFKILTTAITINRHVVATRKWCQI
jgi:hypothetical protein